MIFNKIKELKQEGKTIGITFSTFDMLHAGHIAMLSEAKNHCDYLIAGLQTDPTIDRPDSKNPPIQSIDLLLILPLDVRVLGVEYEHTDFTGKAECFMRDIELIFNGRDHSFSSSSLRKRVAHAETEKLLRTSNVTKISK